MDPYVYVIPYTVKQLCTIPLGQNPHEINLETIINDTLKQGVGQENFKDIVITYQDDSEVDQDDGGLYSKVSLRVDWRKPRSTEDIKAERDSKIAAIKAEQDRQRKREKDQEERNKKKRVKAEEKKREKLIKKLGLGPTLTAEQKKLLGLTS